MKKPNHQNVVSFAIPEASLKRLEKSLRGAAELGSALALLSREILRDVKSAEAAIASLRQASLPLPETTPAQNREQRYDENTKRLSRVIKHGGGYDPRKGSKHPDNQDPTLESKKAKR